MEHEIDMDEARALLAQERERALARIAALGRGIASIDEATSLTATDDEHDPEGSTIAFERTQARTLLADTEDQIREIDAAARRIDDGTYGLCEVCGGTIATPRLRARPAARMCIACASQPRR